MLMEEVAEYLGGELGGILLEEAGEKGMDVAGVVFVRESNVGEEGQGVESVCNNLT